MDLQVSQLHGLSAIDEQPGLKVSGLPAFCSRSAKPSLSHCGSEEETTKVVIRGLPSLPKIDLLLGIPKISPQHPTIGA